MSSAIDTMILVYAGLAPAKSATAKQFAQLSARAKLLILMLAQKRETIVVPTIVVSELLVPLPQDLHGRFIAEFQKRFICPPFDLHAAEIAAVLWSKHAKLPQDQQYTQRKLLKADVMIVASAKAAGATDFYSHEKACRTLASQVMQAHDLPKRDPNDMFLLDDIERGEA